MRIVLALAAVFSILCPRLCLADVGPKVPHEAIFVSPGLLLARSSGTGPDSDTGVGLAAGVEVTAVYWHGGLYAGLEADWLYDGARDGPRLMVGPLVGLGPVGLEGGCVIDHSEGGPHHGWAVGAFFSVGVAAVFARHGFVEEDRSYLELGVAFKLPLPVLTIEGWGRPQRPPENGSPGG